MSNIINFNNYRKPAASQSPAEEEALRILNSAFATYLRTFSTNALMLDVHTRVGERFARLQIVESISELACKAIIDAGMDPNAFRIDPVAFLSFQSREIPTVESRSADGWEIPPELYWNGPYYDWRPDGFLIRAATTVLMHEDGTAELLVDLMKMEDGAQHWLMWHDGVWETDEFLEAVEEELRQREMVHFRSAAFDDAGSVDALMLPQYILNALHQNGIETIEDLGKKTDAELLKLKGIWKRSVEMIREALEER